ncbi:MAG: hypothetical protein R3E02_04560 [Blastomonas sp.]
MRLSLAAVALLSCMLAGCGGLDRQPDTKGQGNLEQAAIDAGLVVAESELDLQGLYERQSGLGTDRFCAIGDRVSGYRIGVLAVFGRDSQCEAQGRAVQDGARLAITLDRDANGKAVTGCAFETGFDGTNIRLPGNVPNSCAKLCSDRASLAGVSMVLTDTDLAAAQKARGRALKRLCPAAD